MYKFMYFCFQFYWKKNKKLNSCYSISLLIWYISFGPWMFVCLCFSSQFQEMLGVTSGLLQAALDEVDQYCEFNKWLNEIHAFCKRWNDKSAREFKGEQAFTIEVRFWCSINWPFDSLRKIASWRTSFPSDFSFIFSGHSFIFSCQSSIIFKYSINIV